MGKVNFLIKALTEQGLIKLKRFKNSKKKSAYLYILTPEGIKKKAQITIAFLERKVKEYNKLKDDIKVLKRAIEIEMKEKEKVG